MNTPYMTIYDYFVPYISDYTLADKTDVEFENYCYKLMLSAIPKVKTLKNSLSDRNEETKEFNNELLEIEIVVLALQMVSDWIYPRLYNSLLVRPYFGTNEDKFFSQANQIEALRKIKDDARLESNRLRRTYEYQNNSYLMG